MNLSKSSWITLALILAVALGYAGAKNMKPDESLNLRSYSVPSGRAEEIRDVLNRVFSKERTDGVATVFGDNVLLVKGSDSYQAGIAKMISQIGDRKSTARSIRIQYWLVQAEKSAQSNAEQFKDINPALNAITQAEGSKKFTLVEHISSSVLDRRESHMKGSQAEFKAMPRITDNGGVDISVDSHTRTAGEIRLDTQVKSGEVVVLGENGTVDDKHGGGPVQGVQSYHIIRADIVQ